MFVNTETTCNYKHKNGLCIQQRRGGKETLVQWQNGDQRWYNTNELDGHVVLVNPSHLGGDHD